MECVYGGFSFDAGTAGTHQDIDIWQKDSIILSCFVGAFMNALTNFPDEIFRSKLTKGRMIDKSLVCIQH